MKRMGWLPRLSLFVGLAVYMIMAMQGRDPVTALEKALMASVILYGLGIFYLLAFWQLARRRKVDDSAGSGTESERGMDGAISGAESASLGSASK